jgi:hypothetical protein
MEDDGVVPGNPIENCATRARDHRGRKFREDNVLLRVAVGGREAVRLEAEGLDRGAYHGQAEALEAPFGGILDRGEVSDQIGGVGAVVTRWFGVVVASG